MIDKNPQALALAYKKCKGKITKIKELDISVDMSADAVEGLIETLAAAKAVDSEQSMNDIVAGQRWYVEGLVKFSGLSVEEQLNAEYEDSFADSASEAEMLKALTNIGA